MPQIAALFDSAKEYPDPIEGNIKGEIPSWLEGRFMRVGPGIFDIDDDFTVNHFLDGLAIICKMEICNKKVTFSQKFLESEAYKKAMIAKRPVYAEFGTKAYPDPTRSFFSRIFNTLVPTDLTDNNVGALYKIEDEIYSASETCFIHSIDCENLVKKDRHDLMKSSGTMLNCSHPICDADGVTWNIGSTVFSGLKHHVVKIPPSSTGHGNDALKDAKIIASFPSSFKTCLTYSHSFTLSENYIIMMEQPLLVNCIKLAQIGIKGKSIKDCFEWTPAEKNRFHIIEKSSGNVLKTKYISEDPFFVFHFINSFEEDGQLIIDLIKYPSPLILEKWNLKSLRNNEFSKEDSSHPARFVIPIISDINTVQVEKNLVAKEGRGKEAIAMRRGDKIHLTPESFGDPGLEFPTINPRYLTKPYRYYYATGIYDEGIFRNSICKGDVLTGKFITYKSDSEDDFCGEALFVPHPDLNSEEDEGVVLTAVSSGNREKSDYLVILDSKDLREIARVDFNTKFAQTLHGIFVNSAKSASENVY